MWFALWNSSEGNIIKFTWKIRHVCIWHLSDTGPLRYAQRCSRAHHEICAVAWRQTQKTSTDSNNAVDFHLWRKMTKLSRKNPFGTVASPGAYERMAVCNWRSSSLYSCFQRHMMFILWKPDLKKKLELATATVSPFLRVEKSANAEPEPAPASLSSDTGLSIETEKYYAVDYVNQFYIGRVLSRSDREGYWQMKFLHQYTRNGKVRFRWQRTMMMCIRVQ